MVTNNKKISIKELFNKINEWYKFLLSKWLLIFIFSAVGAALGLCYAFFSEPVYEATTSFVLSSNSNSNSNLMGLANQFGLDFGGGSNDAFSGDNIISLMKSRKMIEEALMKKADQDELLVNIIIKDLKLEKGWAENERTKGAFPFPDRREKFTKIQDSILREVYLIAIKSYLNVSKPDEDLNIYSVTTISTNEDISFYLNTYLVDVTSAFYIGTKTSLARQNLRMLQAEADSLRHVLGGTITQAASQFDATYNLNPAFQAARSGAQQSQVTATAIGTAYGEVLRNLELAKITLQKETPLFQVIDEPSLPLKATFTSKLIYFIGWGGLAFLLACCLLILKKVISEAP